jgi:hypothetical protein
LHWFDAKSYEESGIKKLAAELVVVNSEL